MNNPMLHGLAGITGGAAFVLALCLATAPVRAQTPPAQRAPGAAPAPPAQAPEQTPEEEPADLGTPPPRIDLGIDELRQELDRAERVGDTEAQAKAFAGLGTLYTLRGRNVEALAALKQAESLYETLGNQKKVEEMRVLIQMVAPPPEP